MKLVLLLVCLFNLSCSHTEPENFRKNQYWNNLLAKYDSKSSFMEVLAKSDSKLNLEIEKDSKDLNLINLWGQSLNFDSGAKKIILAENIIAELQSNFGIKNDNKIVHAGIMHTYGYLFSTLETPYGLKRKRWIEPTINLGFDFKDESIGPYPFEGTLLSNITFFAGRLSFTEKQNLQILDQLKNVSNEVRNFSYNKLKRVILLEEITTPINLPITLKTTLVKFNNKVPTEENDFLLIYSTLNRKTKIEQLITAFPIKLDAYKKIIEESGLGVDRPIIVKYNGHIGSDHDSRQSGKRLILKD